jgi:hypothetical protein
MRCIIFKYNALYAVILIESQVVQVLVHIHTHQ